MSRTTTRVAQAFFSSSCCENYHGECYGEGCRLNPMPEPSEPDTQDGDDDSDN